LYEWFAPAMLDIDAGDYWIPAFAGMTAENGRRQ